MSLAHISAVFAHSKTRGGARLVMLAIADRANEKDGRAWPGMEDLSQRTGLSRAACWRAINAAEALGELKIERYRGPHHTHRYTIILPNCFKMQPFQNETSTVSKRNINCFKMKRKPEGTRRNHHSSSSGDDGFRVFWELYPRKVGKKAALDAWQKCNGTMPPIETLTERIKAATESDAWQRDEGKYIPHPATWISGHRWEDEIKPTQPKRQKPTKL
jgi:hypothetical protein